MSTAFLLITIYLSLAPSHAPCSASAWIFPKIFRHPKFDYEMVVIGAGASGMFAAGTASAFGFKTLLIEKEIGENNGVGGDCTNAACVPSKAVRSVAKTKVAAELATVVTHLKSTNQWLHLARAHSTAAVEAVRKRENSAPDAEKNPNLDIVFVQDCYFVSNRKIKLKGNQGETAMTSRVVSAKKIIIATGSSPLLPEVLKNAADRANIPYDTYRSLLRPSSPSTPPEEDDSFWNILNRVRSESYEGSRIPPKIVLIGGGATACELGQALGRIGGEDMEIIIVAPKMLPTEDYSLQEAAVTILARDNCRLRLGARVLDILKVEEDEGQSRGLLLLDDGETVPVDRIIFCLGRTPEQSLASLNLENAGIAWMPDEGVMVNTYLRSKTVGHVYAAGDCASAIYPRDRRAIHAGWTGFHAVRNALIPWFLRSPAVHPCVPRVVYTDPEMASAGQSHQECVERYGDGGFDHLRVNEEGMDRADMDRVERSIDGNFVELRAEKISGRIIGATACGPAASETINEVCLAIVNKMTVRDIARTLHSYPSHGYTLYRISMALATQSLSGLLSGCGPVGRCLSVMIRLLQRLLMFIRIPWVKSKLVDVI